MIDWLEPPVDLIVAGLASLLLAWFAYRRRGNMLVWFVAGFGAYIAMSQLIRYLIPKADQQFEPGIMPGASYVLWSDAGFRSDFFLVLLVIGLGIILMSLGRRLTAYADDTRLSKLGLPLPPSRPWQRLTSAVLSAFWLLIPILIWIWAAVWFASKGDYPDVLLPALGFVVLAVAAGLLWYWLDDWQRNLALAVLAAAVVIAQLRFNATRPTTSMFESNGSFPFFLSLIPIFIGLSVAQTVNRTMRHRQTILMAWRIGSLLWLTAGIGWLVKFMGFYDFQTSFAFDLASLLEAPLRIVDLLSDAYYYVVPREIAEDRNIANMKTWETRLAFLGGMLVWLMVAVTMRRRAGKSSLSRESRLGRIHLSLQQKRYVLAFTLLLPAVGLRTFTSFYPFLQSIILSIQKYNPAFPPRRYYDFRNFDKLSTDLVVRESLEFTLVFVFVSTFFQIVLGLAIAHLLNANFSLRGLARTISLIPWAVPMVVAAIGFKWMFDDQFGLIPDMLRRLFGYDGKWLVDPGNAKIAVIFVNIWKSTPFCALLLLAGLQGVSPDLYEAAKVDGANWVDALRFITVPMLMPIIVTTTMFMLVWQLAVFDLPFAMTGGAPGFSTTVVAQKIYLEINSLNYSFASAVSITLVFVVLLIGGIGLYALRRVEVSA